MIVFKHELPVVVVLIILTVAPLHASDAVGAVNVGVAVQLIVALPPALPIVGPCVSANVITWVTVTL